MDICELQAALNARGHAPALLIDGRAGRTTMAAVDAVLAADVRVQSGWRDWSDARRMVAVEQLIMRDAGVDAGAIDGLVGEQTRYAREVFAARARGDASAETWRDKDTDKPPLRPQPAKSFAWPRQGQVVPFFGLAGSRQVTIEFPFPMRLAWDPGTNVFRTSCHEKALLPLKRIWTKALDHYGLDEIKRLRLDMFGGCLNVRKMRGGSAWSMHAWGIAWDVDPDRNRLKWGRDLAALDDAPYAAFWSFVEAEGGVSLGRARNYDWMHFQFARL